MFSKSNFKSSQYANDRKSQTFVGVSAITVANGVITVAVTCMKLDLLGHAESKVALQWFGAAISPSGVCLLCFRMCKAELK